MGFDRLPERVKTVIGENPQSGHLFVLRSRRGDRLKILVWDRDGFVSKLKRLPRYQRERAADKRRREKKERKELHNHRDMCH